MNGPRSAGAVQDGMLALLPPGAMWPRAADTNLGRLLRAPAELIAGLEADAEALLAEADVRQAVALLADYERVLGPDECGHHLLPLSTADRQRLAHARWVAQAGQTPADYVALAAALGAAITVTEQVVWQCGLAEAGDELVPEGQQYIWQVTLPLERLIEAEAGQMEAGDPLGSFGQNLVECVIRAARPAHTEVVFSYA